MLQQPYKPTMLLSGGDPRVRDWPLMGSPTVIFSIIASYLYFSLRLGPKLMRKHKPMPIRPLVVAYDVIMVLLSVYFFCIMLQLTYLRDSNKMPRYNVLCQGTDPTHDAIPVLYHGWLYMLLKIAELLDTVFFVLLKKNGHVSFLHLLHHTAALSTVWLDINSGITGQAFSFPILNAVVHTAMYTYYGLAALGPSVRPSLWWKKYVTLLQIVQFLVVMLHAAIPLFYGCGFPRGMAYLIVIEAGVFAWLFSDFYYRNYLLAKKAD